MEAFQQQTAGIVGHIFELAAVLVIVVGYAVVEAFGEKGVGGAGALL